MVYTGARAMNLAGLKTITAKHLALAAQCAAFVAALVCVCLFVCVCYTPSALCVCVCV